MILTQQQAIAELRQLDRNSLIYLRNTTKAQVSLHEFYRQAWPWVHGEQEYVDGWHIGAMAEHLEAVIRRQIRRLIISIPPRLSKSTLVSIVLPAWVWASNPVEQFVYASHSLGLSLRDSGKCRTLIQSPWYQERWGHMFKLSDDQNTKSRFENNRKGHRIATSVGSRLTGEGGSILIGDDLNDIKHVRSDAVRESVIDWLTQVWSTRLNDSKTGCRIIIQQRSHEVDVTGYTLRNDDAGDWVELRLPMELEESRRVHTIVLPSCNGKVWTDPRTEEGALLWPEKFDEEAIRILKDNLSASDYAAQYQQRPSPAEGGIFKKSWFQWWKQSSLPPLEFVLQSWDTAFATGKLSSYSACTTWGVFYDQNDIENVILLSMWRGRVEYVELRERAKRLYYDYMDTGKHPIQYSGKFYGRPVDLCLVEARASGDPLIKDLILAGIKPLPVSPPPTRGGKGGSDAKVNRAQFTSHLVESGRVWLPSRAPHFEALLPFADEFQELAACFPNLESNDVIDTATQALNYLKNAMFIYNPGDGRPEPPSSRRDTRVY